MAAAMALCSITIVGIRLYGFTVFYCGSAAAVL